MDGQAVVDQLTPIFQALVERIKAVESTHAHYTSAVNPMADAIAQLQADVQSLKEALAKTPAKRGRKKKEEPVNEPMEETPGDPQPFLPDGVEVTAVLAEPQQIAPPLPLESLEAIVSETAPPVQTLQPQFVDGTELNGALVNAIIDQLGLGVTGVENIAMAIGVSPNAVESILSLSPEQIEVIRTAFPAP